MVAYCGHPKSSPLRQRAMTRTPVCREGNRNHRARVLPVLGAIAISFSLAETRFDLRLLQEFQAIRISRQRTTPPKTADERSFSFC